jgi:hypothetical protein
MTANPLKIVGAQSNAGPVRSAFRASEWAQLARSKGREATAKLWDQAHKDGWDELNWCPLAAEKFRREVADAQKSWG